MHVMYKFRSMKISQKLESLKKISDSFFAVSSRKLQTKLNPKGRLSGSIRIMHFVNSSCCLEAVKIKNNVFTTFKETVLLGTVCLQTILITSRIIVMFASTVRGETGCLMLELSLFFFAFQTHLNAPLEVIFTRVRTEKNFSLDFLAVIQFHRHIIQRDEIMQKPLLNRSTKITRL